MTQNAVSNIRSSLTADLKLFSLTFPYQKRGFISQAAPDYPLGCTEQLYAHIDQSEVLAE